MFSEVLPAQWLTENLCIFIPYCCQNWRHQCQELFLHLVVGNAMLINTNVYSDLHMSSQKGSFVIAFLGTSSPTLFSLNWSLLFFLRIRSLKISLLFVMWPYHLNKYSPCHVQCIPKNYVITNHTDKNYSLFYDSWWQYNYLILLQCSTWILKNGKYAKVI